MINDYELGSSVTDTLIVKSSEVRMTKTKKKYLTLVLTDGKDDIQANRWDYTRDDNIPANTVVDFTAQVGEYAGKKQLTMNILNLSAVQDIARFAPQGPMDITDYMFKMSQLIDEIKEPDLHTITQNAFLDNQELWQTVPAANSIHHAYIAGTLKHCVDVATKAKILAELDENASVDLCIAGGLLHDFGKLWCYELDGVVTKYSIAGQMLDHSVLGILKLETYKTEANADKLMLLQHIIASHHGLLEYGATTTPKCIEAWIVNYSDGIDAKSETYREANDKAKGIMTAKLYSCENREHFTTEYVGGVLYQ